MEPFRDRRQDYAPKSKAQKKKGTDTFTCQDCRLYLPYSLLAASEITAGGKYWRCIDCQTQRNRRLTKHTQRIRRELVRWGLEN